MRGVIACDAVQRMDDETFGPEQVGRAAGMSRATLHSWIARKYLPLPPGPGMGRERRFTLAEAIVVAVTAELTKLGLSVGSASHAAAELAPLHAEGKRPRISDPPWRLVISPSSAPAGVEAPEWSRVKLLPPMTPIELDDYMREQPGDPAAFVIVDTSRIAQRTMERLGIGSAGGPDREQTD
jgi:hypothetical protein